MRRGEEGFSIVWVAGLVVAIGIAMAASAFLQDARHRTDEQLTTLRRLERVQEALVAFAALHRRLPCPALAGGDGSEDPLGGGTCNEPDGVVPWKTLGLPKQAAFDGWEYFISYRVNDDAVDGVTTAGIFDLSDCDIDDTKTGVKVDCQTPGQKNPYDFLVDMGVDYQIMDAPDAGAGIASQMDPAIGEGAAFVLISHGPSGQGAFVDGGSVLSNPSGTWELKNIGSAGTYHRAPFNHSKTNLAAGDHFDDILRAMSLYDLAHAAGLGEPPSDGETSEEAGDDGFEISHEDGGSSFIPGSEGGNDNIEVVTDEDCGVDGGCTGLVIKDDEGNVIATLFADNGVTDTSTNADLNWTEDGLGVSSPEGSASGGGKGGSKGVGPDEMDPGEGVIFHLTSYYKSLSIAFHGLKKKGGKRGVDIYLFDEKDGRTTIPEDEAIRQYYLPPQTTDGDAITEFWRLNAPESDSEDAEGEEAYQAFNVIKVKILESGDNAMQTRIYAIAFSGDFESTRLAIEDSIGNEDGEVSGVEYCDDPPGENETTCSSGWEDWSQNSDGSF